MNILISYLANLDPVEEVILDYVKNKPTARSLNSEYSSEEYFYLSIARDIQNFSLSSRLCMRQKVLKAFEEILENEDINFTLLIYIILILKY